MASSDGMGLGGTMSEGRCCDLGNFSKIRLSGKRLSGPTLTNARSGLVPVFQRPEWKVAMSFGSFFSCRLAGHLFRDRWKDQGRGFILLPPWPPHCLGQMLTVRDFSQHLVSSSKTIRPNIPRGARCMGHCEMM